MKYCFVGSLFVSGGAFVTVEVNFSIIQILMLTLVPVCVCCCVVHVAWC